MLQSVRVVNGEGGPRCTMHKKTGFNGARQKESKTSRGEISNNQMCRGTIAEGQGDTKMWSKPESQSKHQNLKTT